MRVLLALTSCALGANAALTLDLSAADKTRPITKVVNLLKDMKTSLEKEVETDQEVYDKMVCWCTKYKPEKETAIENAKAKIIQLQSSIEMSVAQAAALYTEVQALDKEIAQNEESNANAKAIRKKEAASFASEETDLIQSITALKGAVVVLEKHNSAGALLQTDKIVDIASILKNTMRKHQDLVDLAASPSEQRSLQAFIAQPDHLSKYNSQSGSIFGILTQMLETFDANLKTAQEEEAKAIKNHDDLVAAKQEEIDNLNADRESKFGRNSNAKEFKVQSKEEMKNTEAELAAAEEFLAMLTQKCAESDTEFAARSKSRNEEITAVGEAITILTDDDAHDNFSKTVSKASDASLFIQLGSRKHRNSKNSTEKRRNFARSVLVKAAAKVKGGAPKLVAIASSVKLDAFTKVRAAIDEMVTALRKEKDDEIKHKYYCIEEHNNNDSEQAKAERDLQDAETQISQLEGEISKHKTTIDDATTAIAEANEMLKKEGEDREKQNAEYQTSVADARTSQQLLQRAITVLEAVYAQNTQTLMQFNAKTKKETPATSEDAPATFKAYNKNQGNTGIISLLQQIMADAKVLESELTNDEQSSQETYETVVQQTNKTIERYNKTITDTSTYKATAEQDKVDSENEKGAAQTSITQLGNSLADLKRQCDFITANFDVRQQARDEEIEALGQAKAILSGAKFTATA